MNYYGHLRNREKSQEKDKMEFRKSKDEMEISKLQSRIEELELEVENLRPYKEEY